MFDENGNFISPENEYNDNGIDTRTGFPFYNVDKSAYSEL